MASCGEIKKLLSVWVDGELSEGDTREVELHIAECNACRSEVETESLIKSKLRQVLPRATAPAALRAKMAALSVPPEATPGRPVWPLAAAGLTAAAAIAATVALVAQSPAPGAPLLLEESVERHSRDLPVEIPGPSTEQVSSWFRGKVAFPVHVPRLPRGTNLLGGRLSPVNQEFAAHLTYERAGHKITVLVFDPHRAEMRTPKASTVRVKDHDVYLSTVHGYQVAVFQDEGVGYAITADLDDQELTDLVAAGWNP
jgi:anti-sigma factor RsiW